MPVIHECNRPGCRQLTKERYCQDHLNYHTKVFRRDYERKRADDPIRAEYKTKRWAATRKSILLRDIICKHADCNQAGQVVDHIIKARDYVASGGDFYDETNLQAMCKQHHDQKTAHETSIHKTQADRGSLNF